MGCTKSSGTWIMRSRPYSDDKNRDYIVRYIQTVKKLIS